MFRYTLENNKNPNTHTFQSFVFLYSATKACQSYVFKDQSFCLLKNKQELKSLVFGRQLHKKKQEETHEYDFVSAHRTRLDPGQACYQQLLLSTPLLAPNTLLLLFINSQILLNLMIPTSVVSAELQLHTKY